MCFSPDSSFSNHQSNQAFVFVCLNFDIFMNRSKENEMVEKLISAILSSLQPEFEWGTENNVGAPFYIC